MAECLNNTTAPADWDLGTFVAANIYDQRALLGTEVAAHPLAVLYVAANRDAVPTPEIARGVHEWMTAPAWQAQPAAAGLVQFVTELRHTIYTEIPRGERVSVGRR